MANSWHKDWLKEFIINDKMLQELKDYTVVSRNTDITMSLYDYINAYCPVPLAVSGEVS